MKNEKINLSILLIVSLLLSLTLYLRTHIISSDGAFQYISLAKHFVSGSSKEGLAASGQQPFYPFLIALLYQWIPDFEISGRLIASLFGVLLIFPVYCLGRQIFEQKIVFFSALLLSIHPYIRRFSADVLKESTYLFFLATALWFSWKTIQGQKKYPYLLIPFLAGLAYLARPDGVEILLVVFFHILFIKKNFVSGEKRKVILLLFFSSAIFFLPYLLHLKESTGTWTLSRTKSFFDFFNMNWAGGEIPIASKILFTLKTLNSRCYTIFHPLYLFLMAVGLLKKFSMGLKEGEKFLISFLVLHYIVLFLLILNVTKWAKGEASHTLFYSGRHALPFLIFSIYWMGEGFLHLHDWLHDRMGSLKITFLSEPGRRSMFVWFSLFLLALALILPKTLKSQRYERLPEKWAGRWIKNQYGQGTTIFTTTPRVAFYAEGRYEFIDLKKGNIEMIRNAMTDQKAVFLVLRKGETDDIAREVIQNDFIELSRFEGKGMETVIIYKKAR